MKLYVIILCLILLYLYGYFVHPQNVSIMQTTLEEFDFNLLLIKQPIVIEDCIKDVISVLDSWFSTNIIRDVSFNAKHVWNINSFKYLYVYARADGEVYIHPPSTETVLAIKLKSCQSIIVPYRWRYNVKNTDSVKMYGVHDYATYLLDIVV